MLSVPSWSVAPTLVQSPLRGIDSLNTTPPPAPFTLGRSQATPPPPIVTSRSARSRPPSSGALPNVCLSVGPSVGCATRPCARSRFQLKPCHAGPRAAPAPAMRRSGGPARSSFWTSRPPSSRRSSRLAPWRRSWRWRPSGGSWAGPCGAAPRTARRGWPRWPRRSSVYGWASAGSQALPGSAVSQEERVAPRRGVCQNPETRERHSEIRLGVPCRQVQFSPSSAQRDPIFRYDVGAHFRTISRNGPHTTTSDRPGAPPKAAHQGHGHAPLAVFPGRASVSGFLRLWALRSGSLIGKLRWFNLVQIRPNVREHCPTASPTPAHSLCRTSSNAQRPPHTWPGSARTGRIWAKSRLPEYLFGSCWATWGQILDSFGARRDCWA